MLCKIDQGLSITQLLLTLLRYARLAYRSGVTVGVTAPSSSGFLDGLGTAFNTRSPNRLASGAVVQDITALHVNIDSTKPSVSTQIAALRHLLNGGGEGELKAHFANVVKVRGFLSFSVDPTS